MSLRKRIEETFGPQAFQRPTFYRNPGGLRFKLSTGGSAVEQFLTAHRKAGVICQDVFGPGEVLTVCFSVYLWRPAVSFRRDLRDLAHAGFRIPSVRDLWTTVEDNGVGDDPATLLHIAFSADRSSLDIFLWCALVVDLGIQPCPRLTAIRLINLEKSVLVHPYDDRGMDVVGPNHQLLSMLYWKFEHELLEHDRHTMAKTFE